MLAATSPDREIVELVPARSRTWPGSIDLLPIIPIVTAHIYFRDPYYSALTGAIAGFLGVIVWLAVTRYAAARPPRMPTLELFLAYVYLQYGVPVTGPPSEVGVWFLLPRPESHESAVLLALACMVATIVGFTIAYRRTQSRKQPKFLAPLDGATFSAAARIHVPIAAACVIMVALVPTLKFSLGGWFQLIDLVFGRSALGAVATVAIAYERSRVNIALLVIALLAIFGAVVISSMLGEAVLPLAVMSLLWWRLRGRIPVLFPLLAVTVMLILQPVKGAYRSIRWLGKSDMGVAEAWSEAFARSGDEDKASSGAEATRDRLGDLSVLAYTMEVVPNSIPHTNGLAYSILPIAMIPRVVWPEKPNMTKAGLDVFTLTLGLQSDEWTDLSAVGITLPTHGYLEHGAVGSIVWMLFAGVIFGVVTGVCGPRISGTIFTACFAPAYAYASASGLVSFVGSLWQAVAGGALLTWFLYVAGKGKQRQRALQSNGGQVLASSPAVDPDLAS